MFNLLGMGVFMRFLSKGILLPRPLVIFFYLVIGAHYQCSTAQLVSKSPELSTSQKPETVFRDTAHKVLGPINTSYPEYGPSLTLDQKRMVFTRKVDGQEDLYISEKIDSVWQRGDPIDRLNTQWNEGAHTLSADGRTIFFTRCGHRVGYGSCDLFTAQWDGRNWSEPQNMGENVNSYAWESHPAVSPGGRYLFFSSDRKGGYGGRDLWVSIRSKEGVWSDPINLGADINTAQDETSPFLHCDGVTLYFSSTRPGGQGGKDFYMARNMGSGEWTTPQNLGEPINDTLHQEGLFIPPSGDAIYYHEKYWVRDQEYADIRYLSLPETVRPQPTMFLSVQVVDEKSLEPIHNAQIEISNAISGKRIAGRSSDKEGEVIFPFRAIPVAYISVEHEDYMFFGDKVVMDSLEFNGSYQAQIKLKRIRHGEETWNEGEPYVLSNIFFAFGSAVLDSSSNAELDKLGSFLRSNEAFNIEIFGHTDNVGSEDDNQVLSEDRALAVVHALKERGVPQERMTSKGCGASQPIADNETDVGRAMNRRIEFLLTE